MTSLLSYRVAPSPGALRAAPFTAEEIDRHPDADRIWATILQMRKDQTRTDDWNSADAYGED